MSKSANTLSNAKKSTSSSPYKFGVGLRHEHYQQALTSVANIDFVEVHTENFFAPGGAGPQVLSEISELYDLSLHCTAMGLGNHHEPSEAYLQTLQLLEKKHSPMFVSDHASFNSGINANLLSGDTLNDGDIKRASNVFTGDLLPLAFNKQWLDNLSANVNHVQNRLGRQILVENLSAYIKMDGGEMSEIDFLNKLVDRTGCGLLLDLNNVLINTHNEIRHDDIPHSTNDILHKAISWTESLNLSAVEEIHLAGFSQNTIEGYFIDDHSQAISDECLALYRNTIQRMGPVATLVEWDNQLPSWNTLLDEIDKARTIVEDLALINRPRNLPSIEAVS